MQARRRFVLGTAALGLLPSGRAHALDAPTGTVVLTLSGQLRTPNAGKEAHFDMAMLERLPQTSFSTRTPWYAQARQFTGPLLRDVLRAAGAHGTLLRARSTTTASTSRSRTRSASTSSLRGCSTARRCRCATAVRCS